MLWVVVIQIGGRRRVAIVDRREKGWRRGMERRKSRRRSDLTIDWEGGSWAVVVMWGRVIGYGPILVGRDVHVT